MSRNAELTGVVRSLIDAVRAEQITFLAASLAYYTFVSLVPLLLLVLVVATELGGERLATDLVAQVGGVLSPSGQTLLLDALTGASGRGGATLVGILVLLWGALKIFRGLDIAFSQVYGTETADSLLGQVRDALVALVAVGAGVGVVVVASALIARSGLPMVGMLGTPALALALAVTFLPLYVILPSADVGLAEALPGALLAGGGWTVLGTGFRIYAVNAGSFQLYGVIGGVLLLVTWFYFGSILLLLGGVLNAVLADRTGSTDSNRQLQQDRQRRTGQLSSMTDEQGGSPDPTDESRDVSEELAALREDVSEFEDEIEDRTVHRDELESDLKRYVRVRVRRGHATGWGPYLVLLYGTVMTLGAFYFLGGGWAVLAMIVVWLSTLGLYVLMVLVGLGITAAGLPGRLRDAVHDFRQ
ncbi:YihY/virulence factor BrkB family protein [Halorientalis salina]|uniref:YihY/virulence factor BrkB family protein n=1 Tax=Halorientalis salina TaxID=2932266 RepID=UPI002022A0DA|nr:YihY/virulence factor BrkB family protein [Halorientalis salina]